MDNPFKTEMVKMQLPEGGGSSISVGGFFLEAEKDGSVEVPAKLVNTLTSHGLTIADAKPAKK